MAEPAISTVVYKSATHPTEGWDVMQVIGKFENGHVANAYVIARAADGTILRKTDVVLDWWEIVADEEDLRWYRFRFHERDRLAAETAAKEIAPADRL